MRTLKKTLCLVLALVMVLGLGAFSVVSADEETAEAATAAVSPEYAEAAAVVQAVGIFEGDENAALNWGEKLTREQAAKILAVLGGAGATTLTGKSAYTDVQGTWAEPYVAFAEGMGYIKGYPDGTFGYGDPLTGYMFTLMLARVLGYNDVAEGLAADGSNWEVVAATVARRAGLDDEIANGNTQITREQAAKFTLNALKADLVEYTGGITVSGDAVDVTVNSTRQVVTAPENTSSAIDDHQDVYGRDIVQLGEDLYKNKLVYSTSGNEPDEFGRPVSAEWTYQNTVVYDEVDTPLVSYNSKVTETTLRAALSGYDVKKSGNHVTYKNTTTGTTKSSASHSDSAKSTLITTLATESQNGYLIEIFANSEKEITTAVITQYGVGEVAVTTATNGNKTYRVEGVSGIDYADVNAIDTAKVAGAVANGDIVTYAVTTDAGASTNQILHIYATEEVKGVQTKKTTNNSDGTTVITVDGTPYTKAAYAEGGFVNATEEQTYYIDQYGYAAYVKGVEAAAKNYAVVVKTLATQSLSGWTYSVRLATAAGGTTDGTIADASRDGGLSAVDANGIDVKKVNGVDTPKSGVDTPLVYYTVANGNYSLFEVKDQKTAGADAEIYSVAGTFTAGEKAEAVITKGAPTFRYTADEATKSAAGTNKTVYVIRTVKNGVPSYSAYTGYAAVPTQTVKAGAEVAVKYVVDDGNVVFVLVDMGTNTQAASSTAKDILYVNDPVSTQNGSGGNQTFSMTAYVNGEEKTDLVYEKDPLTSLNASAGNLYEVSYNQKGQINGLSLVSTTVITKDAKDSGATLVTAHKTWGIDGSETVYVVNNDPENKSYTLAKGAITEAANGDNAYIIPKGNSGAAAEIVGTIYIIKGYYGSVVTVTGVGAEDTKDIKENLTKDDYVYVDDDVTVTDAVEVAENKTLTVNGAVTVANSKTITVKGEMVINGGVLAEDSGSKDGKIEVAKGGTLTIYTTSDSNEILGHIDATAAGAKVVINGDVVIGGNSLVVNNGASADIKGNVTLKGDLTVSYTAEGDANKPAAVTISGDVTIKSGGHLTVSYSYEGIPDTDLAKVSIGGNLTVEEGGQLTINGGVIAVTGKVSGGNVGTVTISKGYITSGSAIDKDQWTTVEIGKDNNKKTVITAGKETKKGQT